MNFDGFTYRQLDVLYATLNSGWRKQCTVPGNAALRWETYTLLEEINRAMPDAAERWAAT